MKFSPGLESFFSDKKEKTNKQKNTIDSACSALSWPQLHRDSICSSLGIDLFSFLSHPVIVHILRHRPGSRPSFAGCFHAINGAKIMTLERRHDVTSFHCS